MRFSDHPVNAVDYQRARELRRTAAPAEQNLWAALRESAKPRKLKFRRQQPIHPYIVDFACMIAKLVIELDGMSHDSRQSYDHRRDAYLREQGYTVMRFTNEDVMQNLTGVMETILAKVEQIVQNDK